jgi:hypothetical protein
MLICTSASLFIGFSLGLRFKLLILVPAMFTAAASIAVIATAEACGLAFGALLFCGVVASLQVGYLGGVSARYALGPGHPRQGQRSSSSADRSHTY